MADILSQSQIDELMRSMQSGQDMMNKVMNSNNAADLKAYDFKSPKKFTKDKLKIIKSVYDNYARLVTLRFNSLLRSVVDVRLVSIEEQLYFEFANILSESNMATGQYVRVVDEVMGVPLLFYMEPGIMVNMMDKVLGGTGGEETVDDGYIYTEIELTLYGKIMDLVVETTKDSWQNYAKLHLGDRRSEENPALFQGVNLDEPMVIVVLTVQMGKVSGHLTICIPCVVMEEMFAAMDRRRVQDLENTKLHSCYHQLLGNLAESTMDVTAVIGNATMNMDDIYQLRVGDVIDFSRPKDTMVTVCVEDQPWFEGRMGVYNKNTAIRLERRIEKDYLDWNLAQQDNA